MAKTILLTGAGFTHNFGGPLAKGMWSLIFNHPMVQKRENVKNMMSRDFDYESIYHKILKENKGEDNTSVDDKEAIKTAVFEAYRDLDNKISKIRAQHLSIFIPHIKKLIEPFASDKSEKSFFFTLNQDLFIERHFDGLGDCKPFLCPGIKMVPERGSVSDRERSLDQCNFIQLPDQKNVEKAKSKFAERTSRDFYYIKLHGSYGWNSSDGSNALVIGQDKGESIAKEPLLSWYLEIFKESLNQADVRLLIIGYGFRDEHINKIIADSIRNNGLKLFILSPEEPKEFIEKIRKTEIKELKLISSALGGYFPFNLMQILDQTKTEDYKKIVDILFS